MGNTRSPKRDPIRVRPDVSGQFAAVRAIELSIGLVSPPRFWHNRGDPPRRDARRRLTRDGHAGHNHHTADSNRCAEARLVASPRGHGNMRVRRVVRLADCAGRGRREPAHGHSGPRLPLWPTDGIVARFTHPPLWDPHGRQPARVRRAAGVVRGRKPGLSKTWHQPRRRAFLGDSAARQVRDSRPHRNPVGTVRTGPGWRRLRRCCY
jgi:hypothetical protein